MKVLIPAPLHSYTGEREVDADGATIGELLADLDRARPIQGAGSLHEPYGAVEEAVREIYATPKSIVQKYEAIRAEK